MTRTSNSINKSADSVRQVEANQEVCVPADLAGVVVGETAISNVEGEKGALSYRGIAIEALIDKPFQQVLWLLITGSYPSREQCGGLAEFFAVHQRLNTTDIALLENLADDLHPMLMLQGLVPLLELPSAEQPLLPGLNFEAQQGLAIAAKLPMLVAARYRLQQGLEIVPAAAALSPNENFLTAFHGRAPSAQQLRILDVLQILQMEHSFNAGTFAGRVCASTHAPIQSSIAASIGTLFGVLHGGADQAALEMAMTIGDPEQAASYVELSLANKEKIMGMGHREYKALDPRAAILKPMAEALCIEPDDQRLLATLVNVEAACQQVFAREGKKIWANVEFYKGCVLHSLGIPPQYFTAVFAMARVYGYIAHFVETLPRRRLIRPKAHYIGQ